ncbi:hypothetical protein L249_6400 [Ophiocordyceps polyrhachis-furcata BCC 54312]|uniref:Uncharacterized protein n=1 Tax=Ophiocordyceps polyrhachis-furcata BCC 54312 TaxID=1330021 RepID=A0A367LL36_9HYPO|nr:hypothetical protein L249_6400 [Ophiocordyceps polyrhachis-furcata BCC 54312]
MAGAAKRGAAGSHRIDTSNRPTRGTDETPPSSRLSSFSLVANHFSFRPFSFTTLPRFPSPSFSPFGFLVSPRQRATIITCARLFLQLLIFPYVASVRAARARTLTHSFIHSSPSLSSPPRLAFVDAHLFLSFTPKRPSTVDAASIMTHQQLQLALLSSPCFSILTGKSSGRRMGQVGQRKRQEDRVHYAMAAVSPSTSKMLGRKKSIHAPVRRLTTVVCHGPRSRLDALVPPTPTGTKTCKSEW